MKNILLSALFISALAPAVQAADKLDAPAALRLEGAIIASTPAARSGEVVALPAAGADDKAVYAVEMTDEASAQALANVYDVLLVRANLALVSLDAAELQALVENPGAKRISLGGENMHHMVDARESTGVDLIHSGEENLPQAFTGENVIVGMMDNGLDINHVNFLKDGEPRAERLWVITGENSSVQAYTTPDAIKRFTVDTDNDTHGTHVLGIMAGGYRGRLKQATMNPHTGRLQVLNGSNKYYGVAPDAILAPCCGTLHGNNSVIAAQKVSEFAREKGLPAVMNYSLGHNYGPHDGTTVQSKFFTELGKEMIICISAGNEGDQAISLGKNFSEGNTSVKTFFSNSANASGLVDIWGRDNSQLKMTFIAVDKTTGNVEFSYAIDKATEGTLYLTGSYYTASSYKHDAKFDELFGKTSSMIVRSGVDAANNRYNIYVDFNLTETSASANIVPGIIVEGLPSASIDMYANGLSFMSNGLSGYSNGNPDQSINDLACGDNVISVGAYVNTTKWPTVDNGVVGFQNPPAKGDIADFSSYGTNFKGEQLPFVCGPGMGMRSSYSNAYLVAHPEDDIYYAATLNETKRNHRWLEMSGTSMSSPFVAGVVALWLQADPTLTVDKVKEAMKATAIQDEFTAKNPQRWGCGKINALGGLKYILETGAVNNVKSENDILITSVGNNCYEVFSPAGNIRAELFNLSGMLVASETSADNSLTVSAENAAPGVYVLRATSGNQVLTRKITVR